MGKGHEREEHGRHDSAAEHRAGEHIMRVVNSHQHAQQRSGPGHGQRDPGEAGPQHGKTDGQTGGQGGVVAGE
ncbi:hypothetical protein QF027_000421 [Streptomyces canus]|nr:hypothetical protein [Streptomyces canus]